MTRTFFIKTNWNHYVTANLARDSTSFQLLMKLTSWIQPELLIIHQMTYLRKNNRTLAWINDHFWIFRTLMNKVMNTILKMNLTTIVVSSMTMNQTRLSLHKTEALDQAKYSKIIAKRIIDLFHNLFQPRMNLLKFKLDRMGFKNQISNYQQFKNLSLISMIVLVSFL